MVYVAEIWMSTILKLSPTTIDKHSGTERDNLVRCMKNPRGECKLTYTNPVWLAWLNWLRQNEKVDWSDWINVSDLDALNQLKQPSRFAD